MDTFEITINRKEEAAWPVSIRHEPGGASLALWSAGAFELDPEGLSAIPAGSREYGLALGKALFRDDVRDAFVRAVAESKGNNEPLRVFLNIEAEDLRSLRWEQLCAPFDRGWDYLLLNQQTPFSLYLPSQIERRFAPIGRLDLKALLLVAGPEDLGADYQLDPFDRAATVESIRAALGEIPCTVLSSVPGAQGPATLDELCAQITSQQPTLLHIVCHGRIAKGTGETVLYFRKDAQGTPVTGTELIRRLGRLDRLPHFAFLSTCESAAAGAETGLGGLAQRLVRELGMPAVLAMTDRISIETAGQLSSTFYARLRQHGEVDRALSEACAGLQGRYDITVPALFSRLGGQPLFSEALNRPLTSTEIRFGLDRMKSLMDVRAPVLVSEFQSHAAAVQPALGADTQALSPEVRAQFQTALQALNQICTEVCDLSFNALALGQDPPPYDARCPFRGLYPFRVEDREFFMGREALIARLVARLAEYPFLAVVGPSGSGKSSLVLAGLIPALQKEAAYLTPGSDPAGQLTSVLDSDEKVVVVDQFEELFTLTKDQAECRDFVHRLLAVKEKQPVVITMRADFWGEVASYGSLKDEMQAHQELIAPMDAAELRSAIERQAARVGLRFEADLSQDIVDDVQGEPGAMPLLQHALLLLWNRRHGRWLRAEEYRAIGGVQQAISRTAEEVYAALSAQDKDRMRDIFLRLTRLDEETTAGERRDTRRRVAFRELVPAGGDASAINNLVQRLADARLAVTGVNAVTGQEEVEVAHEALIRYWPRLRDWLEEDRTSLHLREALREAALEWEAANRDESLLVHRGRRLEDAVELSQQPRFALNQLEQDYLNHCIALQEGERKARERRHRLTLATSIAVSIVMLALALFGMTQAAKANHQAALAHSGELSAQALYFFDKRLDLSLLLSIEAFRHADNVQTRNSLFVALSAPYIDRFLAGHSGPVRSVAFSPDGTILASGSNDNTIILWDMADRSIPRQLTTLRDHKNWVTSLAFSPKGGTLASGSNDNSIILWDVSRPEASRPVASLTGHSAPVYAVAFSPDGTLLASGGGDHRVILWDVSNISAPRELAVLAGHSDVVQSVKFSPDGKTLASGGTDRTIILWDVSGGATTPRLLTTLRGPAGEVHALAFSPDGSLLASGSTDRQVILWDVSAPLTAHMLASLPGHSDAVRTVTFSRDGRTLASGSADRSIILWDVSEPAAPRQTATLTGHSALVYSLDFNPDGETLASGGADNRIILWHYLDPAAPRQLARLSGHTDAVLRLAYSPDGRVLASGSNNGAVFVWDVSKPERAHRLASLGESDQPVYSLAFSPDGRSLAAGRADGKVSIWDVSDPGSSRPLTTFQSQPQAVLSLAFSPDGKILASGSKDNSIILWDVTAPGGEPRQLASIMGHKSYVNSLAFRSDGKLLASGSADHSVMLWDVSDPAAPKQVAVLTGHRLEIYGVALSADGKSLASASADTTTMLWDISRPAAPRQLGTLSGHSGPVFDVAWEPGAPVVASAAGDKTILLWDVSDPAGPRQLAILRGHSEAVYDIDFDPAGKVLASASGDQTIILWNVDPASLVERGCEVVGRNFTQAEWAEYFPGEPYRRTCTEWPEGE